METKIKRFIQILVGILFIGSGFLKALDSQSFAILIANYGFGWAGYISPLISAIEIILGLCLIFDIMPKTTALAVGVITLGFTVAFTYAFFAKGIEDCGCMGSFRFLKVTPFISFARNILIIIGSFWIWKTFDNANSKISCWKKWVVYVIGGLSIGLASYTLGATIIKKHSLEVGQSVNSGFLRFYSGVLSNGISIVFIFGPDCGHCWNSTENVKSIMEIPEFSNVIGIAQSGDISQYMQEMTPNFPVVVYPTAELSEVISEVPVLLVLENGRILKIFKSTEIPCGKMLKKMLDHESQSNVGDHKH